MSASTVNSSQTAVWFDDLISTLRLHELQIATGTAEQRIKEFYETMISNNFDEMFRLGKAASQEFFVKKIIFEYLQMLRDKLPPKLAFDFNDSEVLVWAEIEDDNEEQEQLLTQAEAKINSRFHLYGFDMESMIVEKGDKIPIPNHYKIFRS